MTYQVPRKAILSKEQLQHFQQSKAHNDVVSYIETLNNAVIGSKLTDECSISNGAAVVLDLLDKVEKLAKETPPVDNAASRFGNPAFRTFTTSIPEISVYFNECWGNRTRIDYGSGMELNFLCWLLCLERLAVLQEGDHKAIVLKIFWRYITTMRVLQSSYWLEPAGSHGVWGLDDYHFLPFLFGSAQLRVVEEYSQYYMYFACIAFINSVKTWDKVNTGMIKMYLAEVLGKLPYPRDQDDAHRGHAHAHPDLGGVGQREVGWGDCCGIPVPSVFAAAKAEKEPGAKLAGPGIRPVPFD
ncbi:Phosphotyrosyl phosphatase activator [Pholiota molesta]|nr:Phosphotyrosyl phosphatase activator [Pholiota molesta]